MYVTQTLGISSSAGPIPRLKPRDVTTADDEIPWVWVTSSLEAMINPLNNPLSFMSKTLNGIKVKAYAISQIGCGIMDDPKEFGSWELAFMKINTAMIW